MKRVIYKKNPIIEVILQIRFPKILELNSNDPIEFQQSIKADYPNYNLTLEQQQEITVQNLPNNPIPSIVQTQSTKNHCFISADGTYKINLTSSFISISTVNYTRWEDFLAKFQKPFDEFVRIYAPVFFERVGLRYVDVFSRQKLQLDSIEWKELIKKEWLGAFAIESEANVLNSGFDMEYLLDNKISRAKIHTGIGRINGSNENVFILDTDLIHISNIPAEQITEIQNYLHNNGKELLDKFITEKLHNAMEPEEV